MTDAPNPRMSTDRPAPEHIPRPGESTIPELEADDNVAPRPEEEIADISRAEPDPEG